jgi:hypothetical protein
MLTLKGTVNRFMPVTLPVVLLLQVNLTTLLDDVANVNSFVVPPALVE